jgi:hypothetical protein
LNREDEEAAMAESHPNQRRFPRIRSENPILVKKLDDETVGAFSKTQEVGLGGCMFANHEALGPGALLGMFISVQGRVIEATARVVYERPHGEQFEVGVEFVQIDPVERTVLERLFEDTAP